MLEHISEVEKYVYVVLYVILIDKKEILNFLETTVDF